MQYRQGTITEWDPGTAANKVLVGGTELANVPILNTSEALLLRPGSVVGLVVVGGTWAILGRLTIPGTADAASALSAIRTAVAEVADTEDTTSASFGNLGTVGPTVEVTVGPSGRLLVTVGAQLSSAGALFSGCLMGFALTGANTVAAAVEDSLWFACSSESFDMSASRAILLTGLNAGVTTVQAKYRSAAGGETASFGNRSLFVQVL